MGDDAPIIVLGGRGFIGRKIVSILPKDIVHCVDISGKSEWPEFLRGKKALLVNVSLNSALSQYMHLLWPELVVINEVYPEPSPEMVGRLRSIGCHCYHVVGVKAKAFPLFPGGYEGGIPCCAAWKTENMEALFKRIV
jgi:hypothetical protein